MDDMILIPGGEFAMGSENFYPEERPVRRVRVESFALDRHPITNRQFRTFVEETGYVTLAERPLDPAQFPQLTDEQREPGSLVFQKSRGPVDLRDWRAWWAWVPGASWRHPLGPASSIADKDEHPVVQVSYPDAVSYAKWAGKRLPTEVEWERAARGGADGLDYAWGNELMPGGELLANTWQGEFPYRNLGARGFEGTSPVGTFPDNGYGLVDMIGNVWEWTSTTLNGTAAAECACGPVTANPSVSRITKGGSHLCSPQYCQRYRPAARSPQTEDSSTSHLGFRCARD